MSTASKARAVGSSAALRVAAGAPVPPDVAERLQAGGAALEIDCGGGLGCLALAEAFPAARIVGHDPDSAAIARAQGLALAAGLEQRVTFVSGPARFERARFDLATLRAVSSRSDASLLLNEVRNALTPEGVCLLVEPCSPSSATGAASLPVSVRTRDARARALQSLTERAGFLRFELACRDSAVDVFELRR